MQEKDRRAFNMATPGVAEGDKLGDYLATAEASGVGDVEFEIGAEDTNAIAVAVQLKDNAGEDVAVKKLIRWWLSDAAAGAETGTGPATSTVLSVGVSKKVTTAKIAGEAITSAAGAITFTLTETSEKTWYLNIEVEGKIFSSGAIAFAEE